MEQSTAGYNRKKKKRKLWDQDPFATSLRPFLSAMATFFPEAFINPNFLKSEIILMADSVAVPTTLAISSRDSVKAK